MLEYQKALNKEAKEDAKMQRQDKQLESAASLGKAAEFPTVSDAVVGDVETQDDSDDGIVKNPK